MDDCMFTHDNNRSVMFSENEIIRYRLLENKITSLLAYYKNEHLKAVGMGDESYSFELQRMVELLEELLK